jgi:hypothetical protein
MPQICAIGAEPDLRMRIDLLKRRAVHCRLMAAILGEPRAL